MVTPLGNRLLIKPDPKPTATESGLQIPDTVVQDFDMSGIVVRVGNGPASAHRVREKVYQRIEALVRRLQLEQASALGTSWEAFDLVLGTVRGLREEAEALSEIHEGDHVFFPYTAGTVIEVDGERHLLLMEDQLVAVETPDEVMA